MQLGGKVRETVDRVTSAAADTKQAVLIIGALALAAFALAVAALVLGARRPALMRL
jgi:hypothetical protein